RHVKFINREKGSGSRLLLDELMEKSGMVAANVRGYDQAAPGHIPAAWQIHSGQADCCLATRAAARAFGLDFIPLTTERYDFIIPGRFLDLRSVQILLDILNRSALHRELQMLGGYDMAQAGRVLV